MKNITDKTNFLKWKNLQLMKCFHFFLHVYKITKTQLEAKTFFFINLVLNV